MLLRLTTKLAERVNGLDLAHCNEGDVIDVGEREGMMLLAEGWAEPVSQTEAITCHPKRTERTVAAERAYRGWPKAP